MNPFLWILSILSGILVLVLLTAAICFFKVFYSPKRRVLGEDEYEIPEGEIYEVFRDDIIAWTKEVRTLPHEDVSITSYDGLTLKGKYYEYKKGAITELLFHGYQGNAERDLSGGIERCFSLGRNALIIDHRASGTSDGSVITFGVREKRDVLSWIDFAIKHFGDDVKLVLTGVSMGAATVLMVSGEKLPKNVVCILADCPYSSQKEIIKKVIRDMKLPDGILYPFVKLGARVFGRFDLEEDTPIEAMKRCSLPIIFIHGDTDSFVPDSMSDELYAACVSKHKSIVKISGAGHGLAFPVGRDLYVRALADFEKEWNV